MSSPAQNKLSQWQQFGVEWDTFVTFWSTSEKDFTREEHPYHLDLNIQHSFFPSAMTNKILVTKSYADLYERIKIGLRLAGPSIGPKGLPTRDLPLQDGVLITGQPGTGKSVALWYIAIRLLQDFPREPLIMVQPQMVILFYRQKAYVLPTSLNTTQLPVEIFSLRNQRPSCVALVEWLAGEPPYLSWTELLPIFATSPSVTRTHEFVKRREPFVWGLPTWNRYELRKGFETNSSYDRVRQFMAEYRRPGTLEDMVMEASSGPILFMSTQNNAEVMGLPERAEEEDREVSAATETEMMLAMLVELSVKHFGWVPRDVYLYMTGPNLAKVAPSTSKILDGLLALKPSQHLSEIITELNTATSPLSHQLFMQHAISQPSDDLQNTRFVYHFRTEVAQTLFFKELNNTSWSDLKEVLRITTGQPATRVLGGNLFEPYAHKVLPTISTLALFPMTKATKATGSKSEPKSEPKFIRYVCAPNPQILEVNFLRMNSIEFTTTAPKNIYKFSYYRGCSMTALIDGFFVDSLGHFTDREYRVILYFIQITTSQKKHSGAVVKGPPLLTEIINEVEQVFQLKPDVYFVLVGPPSGIIGHDPNPTWELPSNISEPYSVYHCDLPFPERSLLR